MHFGKQLKLLAYQPWKQHYLDFVGLKHALKGICGKMRAQGRVVRVSKAALQQHQAALALQRSPSPHTPATSRAASRSASPSAERLTSPPPIAAAPSPTPLLQRTPSPAVPEKTPSPSLAGVELISIAEVEGASSSKPSAAAAAAADEEEEFEEVVQLTDDAKDEFTTLIRRERDRVAAFFGRRLGTATTELAMLVASSAERKERGLPLAPLKKSFFDLLVVCEELLDFSRLNLVGFTKIVKKFSRHTDFEDRAETMEDIQAADFVAHVPDVEELEKRVRAKYVETFRGESGSSSSNEFKLSQEIVQSVSAARSWKMNTILFQVDEHVRKATLRIQPKHIKPIPAVAAFVALALLIWIPLFGAANMAAQRCFAILICGTILWVSECWPLFITAILIALLVTLSYVILGPDGVPLEPVDASKEVFRRLFPSNIALMLAGFSISAALTKYKIDIWLANKVLGSKYVRTPQRFLIAVELLCFFMSMWVSNVAAPTLTLTVVLPIIRDLPDRCKYINTILMAIAVSGNVGGMTTQLASPQNTVTVTLGENAIGFVEFIAASLPACPILLITGHLLVVYLFPPDIKELPQMDETHRAAIEAASSSSGAAAAALEAAHHKLADGVHPHTLRERVPWKVAAVIFISLLSIGLWIASNWLTPFGKNIGIISLVPLVLFYATGLLGKDDFERLPWALAMLLAGGSVLGYAVESSKLLSLIAAILEKLPPSVFLLMLVANIIMLIAASFVSHTVAALILLSLSAKVGSKYGHGKLLVMTSVIVDSGAMPLPVSSFPNLNSISVEDADGQPYLKATDFLKIGIPQTLCGFICATTVTYGVSLALGF